MTHEEIKNILSKIKITDKIIDAVDIYKKNNNKLLLQKAIVEETFFDIDIIQIISKDLKDEVYREFYTNSKNIAMDISNAIKNEISIDRIYKKYLYLYISPNSSKKDKELILEIMNDFISNDYSNFRKHRLRGLDASDKTTNKMKEISNLFFIGLKEYFNSLIKENKLKITEKNIKEIKIVYFNNIEIKDEIQESLFQLFKDFFDELVEKNKLEKLINFLIENNNELYYIFNNQDRFDYLCSLILKLRNLKIINNEASKYTFDKKYFFNNIEITKFFNKYLKKVM